MNPNRAFVGAIDDARKQTAEILKDVACRLRYLDYLSLKRSEYDNMVACALADVFENMTDDEIQRYVRFERLEDVRAKPEYSRMCREMQSLASEMSKLDTEPAAEWVKRRARDARLAIERTMSRGSTPKDMLAAATEILERDSPKASRLQQGPNVMIFRQEDSALLEKAMKTVTRKALPEGEP